MIKALRVDTRVQQWAAERPEGRAHSVFERACNLEWGERLISVVLPGYGMMPGGVTAAHIPALVPGQAVRLDLSEAAPWCNRLPLDRVCISPHRVAAMTEIALRHGRGELVGLLSGAPPRAPWGAYARPLLAALPDGDVTPLVGLGDGLTPSCDDFLIGLMAVLHYSGRVSPLSAAVSALAGNTTPISANFLRLAAEGGFSERVEAAAVALLSPGADPRAAAEALIQSGHSSGTDSLVGIIMGAGRIFA